MGNDIFQYDFISFTFNEWLQSAIENIDLQQLDMKMCMDKVGSGSI